MINLTQMGWMPRRRCINPKPKQVIAFEQTHLINSWQTKEIELHDLKGYFIDLHWHLIPFNWLRYLYKVDMKGVWDEAVPLNDPNLKGAFSLSPVHNLAYLCLHLAQHGLQSLKSLLDIDQFVRKCNTFNGWCWERFIACVFNWRMRSAAYHTLHFSRSLYGTPVPQFVWDRLDPGPIARARMAAVIHPLDLLTYPPSAPGTRYPGLVKLALADHFTDLLRVLARIAIPDIRYRRHRYGTDTALYHHWRHVWEVVRRGT